MEDQETRVLIRQRRNELNLTQEELADKIGVSRPLVTQWEGGKPVSDAKRPKLAEALQLDQRDLLGPIRYVENRDDLGEWYDAMANDTNVSDLAKPVLLHIGALSRLAIAPDEKTEVLTHYGGLSKVEPRVGSVGGTSLAKVGWGHALKSGYLLINPDVGEKLIHLRFPAPVIE